MYGAYMYILIYVCKSEHMPEPTLLKIWIKALTIQVSKLKH